MKYLDLTGLGEVWANIKSYISSKIPTKTSQLQNDSNYVTTSQLPSKTSQLINDSDFTTNAKLTSKANDSDVVHKTGNETIAGSKTFSSNIVGNLTGNADTATKATIADNAVSLLTPNGSHIVQVADTNSFHAYDNLRERFVWASNDGGNVFYGTATKATNDSLDNKIDATYLKSIAYNTYSRNLILTKGDGTSSEFRVVYSNQAEYAQKDWNGNNITDTYSTKTELTNGLNSKANDSDVVHKSGNETVNGVKTFNSNLVANNGKDGALQIGAISPGSALIQSFASDGTKGAYIALCNKNDINDEWKGGFRLSTSQPGIDLIGFIDGSLLWCGKNIVRSVNGVNADNNGNVSIQGFSNGIGEIIQGYYVPNGIVQKSGSVYFGTLVQPQPGATLSDFRDINITITDEFHPEPGKIYDYRQIFSTLYLHSYDSEYAANDSFYCGSSPKVDKWLGGWAKVAGSNLVRNSGKYLCTSVSPYGYAVTLRYNLTMKCEMSSYPGGSYPNYSCTIVSKTVPQNQMTVTAKATFMRVG